MSESYEARFARLEENEKTLFHRLDEQREELKNLTRLTVAVEKIAVKTDQIGEKVSGIETRLDSVEKAPAKKWEKFKQSVLTSIVTGVIGILIGAILALVIK